MKRLWIISLLTVVLLGSCSGQENKRDQKKIVKQNAPKTNIKVNKEYDKNGNLKSYDSTYTYYYSNIGQDSALADSIFTAFTKNFKMSYPFSSEPYFNDLFFQDSLLKYDFYKEDFFSERFKKNMEKMNQLFNEMDSLKNEFFLKHIPPIEEKK